MNGTRREKKMRKYRVQYQNHLGFVETLTVKAANMHEATQEFMTELFMHSMYTEQEREQCRIVQITELMEAE